MCETIQPVVREDALHAVSRCEHGTVFLTWQRCTWSFDPSDFARLGAFVRGAANANCALCSGDFRLCPTPGRTQLWVAEVGLTLEPAELERLRNLLENALWAMRTRATPTVTPDARHRRNDLN